jgi:hypothetical protein
MPTSRVPQSIPHIDAREHVKDLLFDLEAAGWSPGRIAKALRVQRTQVRRWRSTGCMRLEAYGPLAELHASEVRPVACMVGADAYGVAQSAPPPA